MIASLTGRLKRKAPDYLIVEVSGVGYQVSVPLSTYSAMPDDGEEVSLHIHTHVREDSLSLFGFLTQAEKEMFLLLLAVSGIGPRLAIAVLSALSVPDLAHAIQASDDSKLRTIPGIGKKTAARMVLELKDKIMLLPSSYMSGTVAAGAGDAEDALSALVNLGYKKSVAEEALGKVKHGRSGLSVEALIKEALRLLMNK
jgi:Holliday junction DNA helicase RuvA